MSIIEIYASGPVETNSIFVCLETSSSGILFDTPPQSVAHWKQRLRDLGKSVGAILFTHSHWDHIADAALAKKEWNPPLFIHQEDRMNLEKPGSDGLPLWFKIEGVDSDRSVKHGDKEVICGIQVEVLHTPGHTPGCVCYYLSELDILISGDTLFQGTIGRLDLPTARQSLMKGSLELLLKLPGKTVVLPGHGDKTTIESEQHIIERYFL